MPQAVARQTAEYKPTYQRFVLKKKSYAQQFSHIYVSRLEALRGSLERQVDEEEESTHPSVLSKIIDLHDGARCIVVGTVLKILSQKPDIFASLETGDALAPIEDLNKSLVSDDDVLVIEDESGRVELSGSISTKETPTGVIIGIKGTMDSTQNCFNVESVFTPNMAPQTPIEQKLESSRYVALVSGLSSNGSDTVNPIKTHLLMDYLAGRLVSEDPNELAFVSSIVRTIIAGDSVDKKQVDESEKDETFDSFKKKTAEELALEAAPLRNLDECISTLAASMDVDLMPGGSDPSNYTLPQQPIHACLLPRSAYFTSFRAVTNPYEAEVDGVSFLGHAGQPLTSLMQCMDLGKTDSEAKLQALEKCLYWRHVAPTAPDLLPCFPTAQEDPFVIEECPHVFFAGNQDEFATKQVQGRKGQQVTLVLVPRFSETSTIVLVDLKDQSCFPITFEP